MAAALPGGVAWLLGVLAFALPAIGHAAEVQYRADVPLSGPTEVSYLRDAGGKLDAQGAMAASARFRPLPMRTVNFGFSSAAYWLHLSVHSLAAQPATVYFSVGQPTLDDVQLYVFARGRLQQVERSGDLLPAARHPVDAARPVLPLQLQPGEDYELYVRVASRMGALLIPMAFESERDITHATRRNLLFNGAFTGAVAALLLYNLFLYAALRQSAYIYYVLLLPCAYFALVTLDGFGAWMLFPDSPWLANQGLALFGSLALVLNALYARALLHTSGIRWLDRLLLGTAALAGLNALVGLTLPAVMLSGWSYRCLFAMMFAVPAIGALAGAVSALRGHPQARFYLLAQLAGWCAALTFALTVLGALRYSPVVRPALLLGGSAQMLLFSLALADHIRALQWAKRRAENTARRVLETRTQELERSVEERTRELDEARRRAEHLATTDALTGVYNRRGLLPLLQQAIERAAREGAPLSLISFDLDHFKRVNDEFGHAEGDRALCQLVNLTRQLVRATDLFGRTGGEEFTLMVNVAREQALQLAERLRLHIETHLRAGDSQRQVTASFGVVGLSRRLATLEALQLAADAALYRAKNRGRNRVETYDATSNETTRTRAILNPAPPAPLPQATSEGGGH